MWTRQLGALLVKDLQLHGVAAGLAIGGLMLVTVIAGNMLPEGVAGLHLSLVFNLNVVLSIFVWGDWLITRERSKHTFAWLRTMPVADLVLASSKFIAAAAGGVLCWCLSSMLVSPRPWESPGTWLALQCVLLLFGAISVAVTWRLSPKIGQIVLLSLLGAPVLLLALVLNRAEWLETAATLWNAPYGPAWSSAALLLVYAATVGSTIRWVSRSDTRQLID